MQSTDGKQTLLVVDDTPENIDILSRLLRPEFQVKAALNGERALKIANDSPQLAMVLLDIMMPDMDGYEVCQRLKNNPATANIPVIFVTAKNQEEDEKRGLDLGAVDYITKPISPAIVLARIHTHLALFNQNRVLEQKVRERTQELAQTRLEIIHRLGRAGEFKDDQTGLHVIRMSHYSRIIAEGLNMSKDWTTLLFSAAPMHDIGKIGMPDRILLKENKLDNEEWDLMRNHPEIGAAIIGEHQSELLQLSREIALCHHEKWDGSGYPMGLAGDKIPLSARIIAIADVFDALTTARPYKKAWGIDDATKYIDDNSGSHFDPNLVAIFHVVRPKILDIKKLHDGRGVVS